MREGLFLDGLLSNSESWINMRKMYIDKLEKQDTILQRKVLSTSGNPSKAFTMLELGIIPIKHIIMKKRMLFLHYLLKQVFHALKEDSKKGDFVNHTNKDRTEIEIDLTNEEIEGMSQYMWEKYIKNKTNDAALKYLNERKKTLKKKLEI